MRLELASGRRTVPGKDGHPYVVRPILPSDARSLMRGYDALPERFKWFRMLNALPHLTEEMALRFCSPDPGCELCLVLEGRGELTGEILGGARITGSLADRACEFSVSLRPEAQGLGLAGAALRIALSVAAEMGYTRAWGTIHMCNEEMLRLARRVGFHLRRYAEDPSLILAEMSLPGANGALPTSCVGAQGAATPI